MIELRVKASMNEFKDTYHVSHKGKCEGTGIELLYEMVEILNKLGEINDGRILADAFEIYINELSEESKHENE